MFLHQCFGLKELINQLIRRIAICWMFHSNIFIYVNAILLSFVLAKSLLNVFTQQRLCHMFHFRNSNRRSFTLLLASTGERYMNPFHLDNFVIWIFRTKANTKTKVEMYCVTSDLLLRLEIARVAIFGWLYCIYSVYTHRTKCVCVCSHLFFGRIAFEQTPERTLTPNGNIQEPKCDSSTY